MSFFLLGSVNVSHKPSSYYRPITLPPRTDVITTKATIYVHEKNEITAEFLDYTNNTPFHNF